jgi:hypothetical protein
LGGDVGELAVLRAAFLEGAFFVNRSPGGLVAADVEQQGLAALKTLRPGDIGVVQLRAECGKASSHFEFLQAA